MRGLLFDVAVAVAVVIAWFSAFAAWVAIASLFRF